MNVHFYYLDINFYYTATTLTESSIFYRKVSFSSDIHRQFVGVVKVSVSGILYLKYMNLGFASVDNYFSRLQYTPSPSQVYASYIVFNDCNLIFCPYE
jgi:hypothetical protein